MSLTLDSSISDFIAYVNQKNLHAPFNKMLVQCDDTLKELLGVDTFAFFGLERILKEKKEMNSDSVEPKRETILVDDTMSIEEIAARILTKLRDNPVDLSGTVVLPKDSDTDSDSTPSTPSTQECEEEQEEEDVYENYDEFHVSDRNKDIIRFMYFEKNGIPIVNINDISFEKDDLIVYMNTIMKIDTSQKTFDKFNDGLIIGILTSLLTATFFSLWLSFVNVGLTKMG